MPIKSYTAIPMEEKKSVLISDFQGLNNYEIHPDQTEDIIALSAIQIKVAVPVESNALRYKKPIKQTNAQLSLKYKQQHIKN